MSESMRMDFQKAMLCLPERRRVTITRRTLRMAILSFGAAAAVILCCASGPQVQPPRYDHVIIVVEENHSAAQVIGSPYLSSLAARGASFSRLFGAL